ncbi:MAG: hypothetical protein HOV80_02465 [Polyangiaceae bacterium]|nr:hypothetical protein [Polyangiaceae bacterium]
MLPLAGAALGFMVGLAATNPALRRMGIGPGTFAGIGAALGALCGASRIAALGVGVLGLGVACIGMLPWTHRASGLGQAALLFLAPTALGVAGWLLGKRDAPELRRPSILASAWDRARIGDAMLALFVWAAILALVGGRTPAAPLLGALAVSAFALFVLDRRAARQLATWRASARLEEEGARVPSEEIDLGTGDDVHVIGQDGGHPYRDQARPDKGATPTRLFGDLDAVLARVRRRIVPAAALGVVGVVASLAALVYPSAAAFRHPFGKGFGVPAAPGWIEGRAPVVVDVDNDGVEDVIGAHNVRGFDRGTGETYIVTATSGATFQTLWSTQPGPRLPDKIAWRGGRLFLLLPENDVIVIDPTTGVMYDSPSIPFAYDLCASDDGLFIYTRVEEDKGQLVSFEGKLTAASRPRDCRPTNQLCTGVKPCTPADAPKGKQLRIHMDDGVGLMDGEPGKPADGEPLWDRHVFGFEPGTLEVRWKAIAPQHQSVEVAYGRVYSHVQSGEKDMIETRNARTGDVVSKTLLAPARGDVRTRGALFTASQSRLYVGLGQRLEVLDADSGKLLGTIR